VDLHRMEGNLLEVAASPVKSSSPGGRLNPGQDNERRWILRHAVGRNLPNLCSLDRRLGSIEQVWVGSQLELSVPKIGLPKIGTPEGGGIVKREACAAAVRKPW
jgi:hypothetical protein